MKQFTFSGALILSVAAIAAAETATERLTVAADVFGEIMSTPDKGIPQDLLGKAQCVIIVPGLKKGAFVVGGEYGRGFALCRKDDGFGWGAPGAVRVEGGSFGAQIGGSSTDVVMLVMNRRGMQKLLGDKFTLGADASVAAGPVGRTVNAATDVRLDAEILAWSRAKGLFAGISLNGATLRNDSEANTELYGRKIDNKAVLSGIAVEPPPAARPLRDALDTYSMRK
jgi:lipid-binding SYLF domain-containing protein